MTDHHTCGKGLAAHAALPAALSELVSSMADVLDDHQEALDLADAGARSEHHAYVTLVAELRGLSAQMAATAQRMTGYANLPMGRHDEQRMSDPRARHAFERFVGRERAVLSLLRDWIDAHESMLRTTPV